MIDTKRDAQRLCDLTVTNSVRSSSFAVPISFIVQPSLQVFPSLPSLVLSLPFVLRNLHRRARPDAFHIPIDQCAQLDLCLCIYLVHATNRFPIDLHIDGHLAMYIFRIHVFYHLNIRLRSVDRQAMRKLLIHSCCRSSINPCKL